MLPCICLVIDHRGRQNVAGRKKWHVVKTTVTHSAIALCATFFFLPHFDVICDPLLDRCTATWNLFVLYNKEINFVRIQAALFHVRSAKVGRSPFWQTREKPFDAIYDLYKMKQSHWLLCVGKDVWMVWTNHATVKLDSSAASHGF